MRALQIETPKERPILFSGPMVQAILAGRKTQTRRVMRMQPTWDPLREVWTYEDRRGVSRWSGPTGPAACALHHGLLPSCPYGQPGDRLWVKETWGLHRYGDFTCWQRDSIRGRTEDDLRCSWEVAYRADAETVYDHWRPSIHMPRWASRILLEVTEVRVQRLTDINEEDARAEGIHRISHGREGDCYHHERAEAHPKNWLYADDAFRALWDSINAKRGHAWETNPWVWAVSFRREP